MRVDQCLTEKDCRAYLIERGWRESVLANDRGWWIDPTAACFIHHTISEAMRIQRRRDEQG